MLQKKLLETYNVLQLLHHGIAGDVWLVEHIGLAGKRVIKSIEKSHPQYDILAKEAKVLQQCQHSSIPIIYDILEFDTQTYIIEEFIEGENLKQYILKQGNLSNSLLLNFSLQLCEILQFLHHPTRAILHLDLKPENILVSNYELKLIDFGSAICQNQKQKEAFIFGTPRYCAPEMKQAGKLSERTDIYCLGRCMEYMQQFTTKVPKGFEKIIDKCLRKTEMEYSCVEEIKKDLERLVKKKRWEKPRENWYAITGVLSEYESSLIALQLASWLVFRYKKPVLYLDCTSKNVLEPLEVLEQNGFVFEWNKITVAKRVAPQQIKGWRGRGYAFVVCDLGNKSPLDLENPFSYCFCVGAMTEWTLEQWKCVIQPLAKRYPTIIALTGGEETLAKETFGTVCCIRKMTTYFTPFQHSKQFGRQVKGLLK